MSVRMKLRIEFGFAGAVLAVLFLFLRGNLAEGRTETSAVRSYGGRLSNMERSALEAMNLDLHDASDVLGIGSQRIRIIDRTGEVKEYRFDDAILWRNQEPLMDGLASFHFEFRDGAGNLLTTRNRNCGSVQSVGYALRIGNRNSEIFVQSGSDFPFHVSHDEPYEVIATVRF